MQNRLVAHVFGLFVLFGWGASVWAAGKPIQLYIMAGQSNMVGGGHIHQLAPSMESAVAPQLDLQLYYTHNPSKPEHFTESGGWISLQPHNDKYFGPEITFAKTMAAAKPDDTIAVFKYAQNGSSLAREWEPGATSGAHLYSGMINELSVALDDLSAGGYEPQIKGFIWVQGSGDSNNLDRAESYDENLTGLVAQLRSDVGVEDLPWTINQYHISSDRDYVEQLRASQAAAVAADPYGSMINVDDLLLKYDRIHYSTDAFIEMGQRLAQSHLALETYLALTNPEETIEGSAHSPEPATAALLGLAGLVCCTRRTRRAAAHS